MWTVLRRWFSPDGWFGDVGEREAARYLKRKNYRILGRQVRNVGGEIDLVALDKDTVVFIEVKTRRGADRGEPFEAVNSDKQRRMTRAALVFLKQSRWLDRRSRFDVISIVWPAGALNPDIRHFEHAFEPADRGQFYS